ncbi:MAG TPA: flagellar motor protein MotB [Azospirillum sp.]|nr:flagellar motor protein MotB [Azospirillum sp.]
MAANPAGTEQPIIIKKKKGGHGGHHGGAWKVAYADFVTAMMAFFLLLWLLNVTTSDQRKGIADYFAPVSVSRETSGSGGMLGGQTVTAPGAQINSSSPMTPDIPTTPSLTGVGGEEPMSGAEGGPNSGSAQAEQKPNENRLEYQQRLEQLAKQLGIPGQKPGEKLSDFADRVSEATAKLQEQQSEGKQFQQTANEIRQAIQSIPELQPLAQNLMIDQTPEGLRIQIVDQDRVSMFPGGSAQMYPQTRQLVMQVAQALNKLPNKLSISGHTDATPFTGGGRDNWDLSTERANATRRALLAGGVPETRVQDVVGRADRDLLVPDQPGSPRNRRISIVLLREAQAKAPAAGGQSAKPAAPAAAPAPAPAPAAPAPARR